MSQQLQQLYADLESEIAGKHEAIRDLESEIRVLQRVQRRVDAMLPQGARTANGTAEPRVRRNLRDKIMTVLREPPRYPMPLDHVARLIDATEPATRRSLESLLRDDLVSQDDEHRWLAKVETLAVPAAPALSS